MSNEYYKILATKFLYAFRAGQFHSLNDETLKTIIKSRKYIINEIIKIPLGIRYNYGALIRDNNSFKKRYIISEYIEELIYRSWRYSAANDIMRKRLIERVEFIDLKKLINNISEFIKKDLGIDLSKRIFSLAAFGGYLWNDEPTDIDIICVIEDKTLSIVEVGGWSTQQINIFVDSDKSMRLDLSFIGAGAINSLTRSHDIINILGWYSGGGVTLYGMPILSKPIPDFIALYLPMITLGFCYKEIMLSNDRFSRLKFLQYRIDECKEILKWLGKLYEKNDNLDKLIELTNKNISLDYMNYSKLLDSFVEQSNIIKNTSFKIAEKIKEDIIYSLNNL